jgi:hypothetical protein
MKKKAKAGKVKSKRKRSSTRDLSAKKAGAVKGGLLPAVKPNLGYSAVLGDGSVRIANVAIKEAT